MKTKLTHLQPLLGSIIGAAVYQHETHGVEYPMGVTFEVLSSLLYKLDNLDDKDMGIINALFVYMLDPRS